MNLSAVSRVMEAHETRMTSYDTEVNVSLTRLEHLAKNFENLPENIITESPIWSVTDKAMMDAEDWANMFFKYAEDKQKDKASMILCEPFLDPYTKGPLHMLLPTFAEIDSLSEFESSATGDVITKDIDSSDTNTAAMKQGLFKMKFMAQLPRLANAANIYLSFTAQSGEKVNIATGPAVYNQPAKKLQYMKQTDNLKGVSSKFYFLITNLWFAHPATPLKNQTTKQPEYPLGSDVESTENELNIVKMTTVRNKTGQSGTTLELVVSQTNGVQPSLTEFHNIKENGRYGISGSNLSYALDLLPEVNLSRTTVRKKIDSNHILRRAINITLELMQAHIYLWKLGDSGLLCTPKELYDDIKKLGYDWNILLNTRGYWTFNQYTNMLKEKYFPYFLNEDKTLKDYYKE
jgi:hypothetical protein